MKIIITGGGTGGHIYPGISLARELQKRDKNNQIVFIGTQHGMESQIIPKEGFEFYTIKIKGFQRKICWENLYAFLLFISSLMSSFRLLRRLKPDFVIGTGGYVSSSVAMISPLLKIPTFIHEQNALPGITNKILSLMSRHVFISFPESKSYFWKKSNLVFSGNPVREKIFFGNRNNILKVTNLVPDKKTVLVFGGSKGASAINHTFLECLKWIECSFWQKWQILMISGKDDYATVKDRFNEDMKSFVAVLEYLYNIEDAYDLASLVVCRAGATTVAELTAKGLPAILIPYPYATGNHQLYNARFLEKQKAAVVLQEKDLTKETLSKFLLDFLENDQKRNEMAEKSKQLGQQNATSAIIDKILLNIKK